MQRGNSLQTAADTKKRILRRFVAAAVGAIGLWSVLSGGFTVAAEKGESPGDGWIQLFDGSGLVHWEGDKDGYVVEDGLLVCKPGGNLYTKEAFSDFVFSFEFKLTPGANNGLAIRSAPGAHAAYDAIELQILDNTAEKYKDIKPYQYHGSVYGVVPAERGYLKPVGEWNRQEVVADGYHIKITLNGHVIVDADIEEASEGGTMDGREHPGLLRKSGRIGFIGHGDVLYFRDIKVKRINGN